MQWRDLLTALCLVFVFEGLLPFVAPSRWKEAMRHASSFEDGQLRIVGLVSMLAGVVLLYFVREGG